MANMSAQILRNLVSSVFNIKPTEVVLSGEISPNYQTDNSRSSGCMYDASEEEALYGFNPQKGFILLQPNSERECSNADGSWNTSQEVQLDLVPDVEDYIFFVSVGRHYYSDNNRHEDYRFCTLCKAPDFGAYFASIEKQDLERWESWVNS